MTHGKRSHPNADLLERFMRNEAAPSERRWVVRHLIAGCSECLAVTTRLWNLGESPRSRLRPARPAHPPTSPGEPPSAAAVAGAGRSPGAAAEAPDGAPGEAQAYGPVFDRLAAMGRRLDREHGEAPRWVAELLVRTPRERLDLVRREAGEEPAPPHATAIKTGGESAAPPGPAADAPQDAPQDEPQDAPQEKSARRRFLTPAVCGLVLARSRQAGAVNPGKAVHLAELALAIAERLDMEVCGVAATQSLMVRSWAHICHARRLAGDLDGAEWALAVAEGLRGGEEPFEAAELVLLKAGLEADHGRLAAAEELLERAAEIYGDAAAARRTGGTLALLGLVRAWRGDTAGAVQQLRSAASLLDPPEQPADWRPVVATLCRLASLLAGGGVAKAGTGGIGDTGGARDSGGVPASDAESVAAAAEVADSPRTEAMQALARARALVRGARDAAAEARLDLLEGEVAAALGGEHEAEHALRAAVAGLAGQGMGREALLAQVRLAQLLARQGRGDEIGPLVTQLPPRMQARDQSWSWYGARLLFQNHASGDPKVQRLLAALGQYLTRKRRPVRFLSWVDSGDDGLGEVA